MGERGDIKNLFKAYRISLKEQKEIRNKKEIKRKGKIKALQNKTKLALMISITVFFRFIFYLVPEKKEQKEIIKLDIKKDDNIIKIENKLENLKEKKKKTSNENELVEIRDEIVDIYKVTSQKKASKKVEKINNEAKKEILDIDKKLDEMDPNKEEPAIDLGKMIIPIIAVTDEIITTEKKEIKEKKPEIENKTKNYKKEIEKIKEEIKSTTDKEKLKEMKEKLQKIEKYSENKQEQEEIKKINKDASKGIEKVKRKEETEELKKDVKKATSFIKINIEEQKEEVRKIKIQPPRYRRNFIFKTISKMFATIAVSNLIFKSKKVKLLVNALTINNGIRSLRSLHNPSMEYLKINEINKTTEQIKKSANEVLDNSLYQIKAYKQEFLTYYKEDLKYDASLMSLYNELNNVEVYILDEMSKVDKYSKMVVKRKLLNK